MLQILGLLELLVKYGYYDSPTDIRNIVHPLTAMLDGRTDVPHTRESMQFVQWGVVLKPCD